MIKQVLEGIDFSRYQRWLNRAFGREAALMVFDHSPAAVWAGDAEASGMLGEHLAGLPTDSMPGMQRTELLGGKAVFYRQLGFGKDGLLGWAGAAFDVQDADKQPLDLDNLAEAFDDLSDALFEDYQCRADLELMTEELATRYEELHLVYAVDQHIQASTGDQGQIFQGLLESTAEHMDVDIVALVMPGMDLNLHADSLSKPIHNLDLVLIEMRGDLFRFVQSSGEALILNAADDPRRAYIFTDMPYKVLACPVRSGRMVDALVVLLNHADKEDFSNSDRKLAEVLANQLSSLSATYAMVQGMRDFNEQMARSLIEAVEAKDPYTRGHSERVNYLSMEIGRSMGLAAASLESLHWSSLLHDVGKIGIPDAVLGKPGALTRDEFTFIKVHPERSYDILRHIKQLEKAAVGARHHQEQFNGKGYPHGLHGERIPLFSRIIAVADTYDSITSSRAYRAGRTHEVAMTEIERVSGTQLDPEIVAIFRSLVVADPEWLRQFNIRREPA